MMTGKINSITLVVWIIFGIIIGSFKSDDTLHMKSLSSLNNIDPKELFKVAIMTTEEAVKKSFNVIDSIVVNKTNEPRVKMAVDDCKDLMNSALQDLKGLFNYGGDSEMQTMYHHVADLKNWYIADLKNWFSAVISYQQYCLDGFDDATQIDPNLSHPSHPVKDQLSNWMHNIRQLAINFLTIFDGLENVLEKFNLKIDVSATNTSHKLYPNWVSGTDNELLAKVDNGAIKPNVIVAKDGSGQFNTIGAALATYPKNFKGRYIIYIKAGIYHEYVTITKNMENVFIYGDGSKKTIVTGNKSSKKFPTMLTATFYSWIFD